MDTVAPTSARTGWTSSLHWRIVLWFVLLIAVVMAAQGGVFLWLVERAAASPNLSETRALSAVLSQQLGADPGFDLDRFAGFEAVAFDETQKVRVLIRDPRDAQGRGQRAGQQALEVSRRDGAFGARDRVTMGISGGPPEHLVDPLDETLRNHVLEQLGLVMHLGPAHPHDAHQEQLDKPMSSQHQRRQLLAGRRETHADVGLVLG